MPWIRMRDSETGHEFDVVERVAKQLEADKAAERVKDYPVHTGTNARPGKSRLQLADITARAHRTQPAPTSADLAEEPKPAAQPGKSKRSDR